MDQQQHMTKTEAHPYHAGPQAVQIHADGRAYDPQCPICRQTLWGVEEEFRNPEFRNLVPIRYWIKREGRASVGPFYSSDYAWQQAKLMNEQG